MTERPEQERIRFEKLAQLREGGFSFPNDVKVDCTAAKALATEVAAEPASSPQFTLAGRIVQMRQMGKASFVHILDSTAKIQSYVKKDEIGEASYELFKNFDIGDIIEIKGYLFVTKTGEKSIHATAVRLLVKALIPLPEKWHGLQDVESRYRYRYVDLIANPDARHIFVKRAQIIRHVRSFLDARQFLEVETPILHYIAGGATAKPFHTHYNSLDCDMYLRIALELPLKKLLVGGFDRVYEIGRNFRNEGISRKHNPEFTMLEFYQAFATYEDLMTLCEEMFCELAQAVCGSLEVPYGELTSNFARPWRRISMLESVYEVGGVSREFNLDTVEGVQNAAKTHQVHLAEPNDWGRSLEAMWGELVEHKLVDPTFITHHPYSISPLSRKNAADPKITDRFELIICGMESVNAFSELNDAVDQRERFAAQAARKEAGDEEASDVDEDFLRALEYGMPPAGGVGIGIDRLVMLLTNSQSIREVVLFPQLKPVQE